MDKMLFTSESVTCGHPDKVCDQVADKILDELLAQDPYSRVACEVTCAENQMHIFGEITSEAKVDYRAAAQQVIAGIGYTQSGRGFDADTCAITVDLHHQSPDIARGITRSREAEQLDAGAGDQGMMFGYTIKQMAEMFGVTEHTLRFYTDRGLLPCRRDGGNRRVFTEESINWMQGIQCLKGCGASIQDIQEYCRLCLLEGSEENLRARYAIILKQRAEAHRRLEEAKATVKYMDSKAAHYEAVLTGLAPDDTNPRNWTAENRPKH